MHRFEDLVVWQKAVDLAVDVYSISKAFPKDEKFGITSQMRRASVSIALNISEGAGRNSDKDFVRFLSNAHGSAGELYTAVIIAERIGYLDHDRAESLRSRIQEIRRMNTALQSRLGASIVKEDEVAYGVIPFEEIETQSSYSCT